MASASSSAWLSAQRIRAGADGAPRNIAVRTRGSPAPPENAGLAAPATANLETLAVDVLVRVDGARTNIGVVPGDDVAAAVANERYAFLYGPSRTGGFDDDIDALAAGALADRLQPFLRRRRAERKDLVGAHLAREGESGRWDRRRQDGRGPGQSAERDRAQANGADALDEHAVAGTKRGAFADVTAVRRPQPPPM